MTNNTLKPEDVSNLRETANLLSHIFLREIDSAFVRDLESSGIRQTLEEFGLFVPDATNGDELENLATEYFSSLVNPSEMPPPIQSLSVNGTYEGEPAKSMREIAKAAGLEFDASAARGAPVDHLGAQLAMWADLAGRDMSAADEFTRRHLLWAGTLLRHLSGESFYGQLAIVTIDFLKAIRPTEQDSEAAH